MKNISIRLLSVSLLVAICGGSDWLQFRGNTNTSIAKDAKLPLQWSAEKNVAFKAALPGRAVNGPIVVGDQVIATSSSGHRQDRLHIRSVDAHTGETRWQRNLWATGRTICHPLSAVASPTPASDGSQIYALFASNDLVCLDLAGNVRWIRAIGLQYPYAFDDRGLASSPIVVDGVVIVQIACQGDSIALGIDSQTGETQWQLPLAKSTNWASPCVCRVEQQPMVALQSADQLMMIEPKTGKARWNHQERGNLIPSPTVDGNTIYVPAGNGLTALQCGDAGKAPAVLWHENRLAPDASCPLIYNGKIYVIRAPNILVCGDAKTGEVQWRLRLKGRRFWATPVIAGNHLFAANAQGVVQVVDLSGEKGKVVAENDMGEQILGSPAVSGDAIYWRSIGHLWKIEAPRG